MSHSTPRETTEQARRIPLPFLLKEGFLSGFVEKQILFWSGGNPSGDILIAVDTNSATPNIRLKYKISPHGRNQWTPIEYSMPLEKVPCHFGGNKWYFRCELYKNGVRCGRRVRVLYEVGSYFGCRKCADLSYESCNKSKMIRHGFYKILASEWKADEYLEKKIKRRYYRGKPTKKYQRYLNMQGNYSMEDLVEMQNRAFLRK